VGGVRERCRRHPWGGTLLAADITAISLIFLFAARQESDLPATLALTGSGVLGAAAALTMLREVFDHLACTQGRRRVLLTGLSLVGVGAATVWVGVVMEWEATAAIGVVVAIVGTVALGVRLRDNAVNYPWVWVAAGLVLVTISAPRVAWDQGNTLTAASLWVGGLAALKMGFLPVLDLLTPDNGRFLDAKAAHRARARRTTIALTLSLLTAVAGVTLAVIGARAPDRPPLLLGVLLGITGISTLGLAGTRLVARRSVWNLVLVVGYGFVTVALVSVTRQFDWDGFAIVVAAVVALVGAWFVFRGEGLVFMLLAGVVLVWALDERNDAQIPALASETPAILAIGDSFISGEGAPTFFEGTNTKHAEGNTCRRAVTAYPFLVAAAQEPPMQAISLACSSALTTHVTDEGQKGNLGSPIAGALSQLESLFSEDPVIVDPAARAAVEVVLVSIGGNDSGFESIVKACLLPANCADESRQWFAKAESLQDRLAMTYQRIDEATGDVPVVVVPYPLFVDTTDCRSVASVAEFAFVVEFVEVLNATIARAAGDAGVMVADTSGVFAGNRQCDAVPAANMILLGPPDGPIADRLDPGSWVHGSMHPNPLGHELQAEVLTQLITALLADEDPSPWLIDLSDAPQPRIPASESLALITAADDQLADNEWLSGQLFATARSLAWPVASLFLGGMLTALALSQRRGRIASFLAPRWPSEPNTHLAADIVDHPSDAKVADDLGGVRVIDDQQ